MSFLKVASPWEPQLRSVLRIVTGFAFSLHGYQKLFGWFGGLGGNKAELASLMGVAGIIETIGSTLIILRLFTRPTVFIFCGQMAVALFMVHLPVSIFPILNGGEITVPYCFIYLWLFAAGPGPWSIDH